MKRLLMKAGMQLLAMSGDAGAQEFQRQSYALAYGDREKNNLHSVIRSERQKAFEAWRAQDHMERALRTADGLLSQGQVTEAQSIIRVALVARQRKPAGPIHAAQSAP